MIEQIQQYLQAIPGFRDLSQNEIQIIPLQTLQHSEVYRVRVRDRTNLILKRAGVSAGGDLATRERRFYKFVAPLLPEGLVPKCLYSEDESVGWLAIEDVSDTHCPVVDAASPTYEECVQAVRALAGIHGASVLEGRISGAWKAATSGLPKAGFQERIGAFADALEPFSRQVGSRIDAELLQFLLSLSGLGKTLDAVPAAEMNTLVHGDAHFSNFLYLSDVRSDVPDRACAIDWAMPMMGFGEVDLAHLLALNLPRQTRRDWEDGLLNTYAEEMRRIGCATDRATVKQRYRIGVLYGFVSPVLWWRSGVPEETWWPVFTNVLEAAIDHDLALKATWS